MPPDRAFHCYYCGYNTVKKSHIRVHVSRHEKKLKLSAKKVKCLICSAGFDSRRNTIRHYQTIHNVACEVRQERFTDVLAFEEWKTEIEKTEKALYVKSRGATYNPGKTKSYHFYTCHRDGIFEPKGSQKRHLKVLGSNKINGCCPSEIRVATVISSGSVSVSFIPTHVGHTNDLERLPLSQPVKRQIAQNIVAGNSFGKILDSFRNSVPNTNLDRVHLITRQDLSNIARGFNVHATEVRHKSDYVRVESWVQEMQEPNNIIRFYKAHGSLMSDHPSLCADDFVLIIANNYQLQILEEFGGDCVCFDGSHGLNQYFEMTTLMTVDSSQKEFPCAFMFSNRRDTHIMTIFVEAIKNSLGHQIKNSTFMSDMCDEYYSAWCEVMGSPTNRLYCTWHVDRVWKTNFSKIAGGYKKKRITYRTLRTLLQETDEKAFLRTLPTAISKLKGDPDTKSFGDYFDSEYGSNYHSWAYCFRKQCGINTNMFLNSMHKTFKHNCMKGGKRLDKAINALMRFVRDKLLDRIIGLNKGWVSSKLPSLIHKTHISAANVPESHILSTSKGWSVASCTSTEIYEVVVGSTSCSCALRCEECRSCIHSYKCSCMDSAIKWNMCKHIHAVSQNRLKNELEVANSTISFGDENEASDGPTHEAFSEDIQEQAILDQISCLRNPDDDLENGLRELDKLYYEIRKEIKSTSELDIVRRQFKTTISTILAARSAEDEFAGASGKRIRTNQKMSPQKRFFSIRARRKVTKPPSIEPTLQR